MKGKARPLWQMPPWMEAYRRLIVNTGDNSIEDLMNERMDVATPLSVLHIAVGSQITLLILLHVNGKLPA